MSAEVLAHDGIFPTTPTKTGFFKKLQNMILSVVAKIKEFVRKIIFMIQKLLIPSQRADAASELVLMEYRKILNRMAKTERETLDISAIPGLSTYNGTVDNSVSDTDIDKGTYVLNNILTTLMSNVKKAFNDIAAEAEKLINKDNELAGYERSTISTLKGFTPRNPPSDFGQTRADMDRMRTLADSCNTHVTKIQTMYKNGVLTALASATKSQGHGLHSTVKEVIVNLLKRHAGNIICYCRDGIPAVGAFLRKIEKRAHAIEKSAQFYEAFSNTIKNWSSDPDVATNPEIANNCQFASQYIYNLSQICMRVSHNYSVVTTYVGKNLGNPT